MKSIFMINGMVEMFLAFLKIKFTTSIIELFLSFLVLN
jgi:hypothetical protein